MLRFLETPGKTAASAGARFGRLATEEDARSCARCECCDRASSRSPFCARLVRVQYARAAMPISLSSLYDEVELTITLVPGEKAGLGISDDAEDGSRNRVVSVTPGSPAAAAGCKAYDLVLAVDGIECSAIKSAISIWLNGAGKQERRLRVRRAMNPAAIKAKTDRASPKPPPPREMVVQVRCRGSTGRDAPRPRQTCGPPPRGPGWVCHPLRRRRRAAHGGPRPRRRPHASRARS